MTHSSPLAFATIDWFVLGSYLVAVLVLGWWFSRGGNKNDNDYFLAGRSMPGYAVTISLIATSLSAATFIGAPDDAFNGNLTFLILYVGNFIAVGVVAFIFVPRLYSAGTTTIYGYLGQRYGLHAQRAAGLTFVGGRLLASGARLFMAATPLWLLFTGGTQSLADGRFELALCVVAVGVVATFYTLMGGIKAIMWTDIFQLALIFGAVGVSAFIAWQRIDLPLSEMIDRVTDAEKLTVVDTSFDLSKPYTLWTALIGNMLFFAAVFGTDHDLAQRFLTAKSAKSGMRSVIGSQFIGIVIVSGFMLLGLLLWIFYNGNADVAGPLAGQPVFVVFMVNELPPVVAGLAVAGLFAAAQSSMDSATNAIAGSLIHDVWRPDAAGPTKAAPTRMVTLGVGAALIAFGVGCVIAFDPEAPGGFLGFALRVMTFALMGLMGVFLCAFYTGRGNAASVIAALITGAAIMLVPSIFQTGIHWYWFVPVAIAASFSVCCVGRNPSPAGFAIR